MDAAVVPIYSFGLIGRTWIGYEDSAQEGTFVWLDGSESDFTNWWPGFANAYDFVCISDGEWHSCLVNRALPSVCKMAARQCIELSR